MKTRIVLKFSAVQIPRSPILYLCLLCCGCSGQAQLAEERQAGQSAYDDGVSQFDSGQYEEAAASFETALGGVLEPDLIFPAARLRALSLAKTDRVDEALQVLRENEQGASGPEAITLARAEVYASAGRRELAKQEYAAVKKMNARFQIPAEYR
ncbi:MAG: hypothetical protein R3C19_12375 [Planctomycetaceae bacterium]